MSQDLLIEIGTEELPPTSLKELSDAFSGGILKGLDSVKLGYESSQSFATPRRLALVVRSLETKTPTENVKMFGPPAKIAFDGDGNPTKAAEAFANKNGISIENLSTESDGKVEKLVFETTAGGDTTESLIGNIIRASLDALPIKKRMRWGTSRAEFVRPVHWSVVLFGDKVIPEVILDTTASNITYGHRFHYNAAIEVDSPENYEPLLRDTGKVLANFDERQALISEQVTQSAQAIKGNAVISEDLLEEVTGLVEWPVPLAGNFDEEFLSVPAEALISSMKEHQKYFHVVDDKNNLLPIFITVSNLESADAQQVIHGNERVIRPRLADAAFFFETDKKVTLESQRERLKSVVFQAKLGTIYDKTVRVKQLAVYIAETLSASNDEIKHIGRAAELCKSDLVSNMVNEFSGMQGIAGSHYATNDGEDSSVANAIMEQYKPKFATDTLPETLAGSIIALADRLDTITGIFGIGESPTGSKDPFALRRASLAVLRILVEKGYELDLEAVIEQASKGFESLPKSDGVVSDVVSYMLDRFKAWYEEDVPAEVYQSVSAKELTVPVDINKRVNAVAEFCKLPEAPALASANKRVSNILSKVQGDISNKVTKKLLVEDSEKALAEKVAQLQKEVAPLFKSRDYTQALTALSVLQKPVDDFFDNVMVMAEDETLKNNRLALLNQLRSLFLEVADISYLAVKN